MVIGAIVEGAARSAGGSASQLAGTGAARPADDLAAALAQVESLVRAGMARSAAVRDVASRTGLPRRQLYRVERD
jgi:hypothetical protein